MALFGRKEPAPVRLQRCAVGDVRAHGGRSGEERRRAGQRRAGVVRAARRLSDRYRRRLGGGAPRRLDGPSTPPPAQTAHGRHHNQVPSHGHAAAVRRRCRPRPGSGARSPRPRAGWAGCSRPARPPAAAVGVVRELLGRRARRSRAAAVPGVRQPEVPIDKDQFIIGRGAKSSDLPIKDGNISRKHAAVIRRNGTYFIKDLGSTNGIDYKGMRIDNKRIDEGDVFHLCDYELRFTYKR